MPLMKMVINGIEITASPSEAAAFLREMEAAQARAPVKAQQLRLEPVGASPSLERTARFMEFMAAGPAEGVTSGDLAKMLNIKEKGIGSALTVFAKELKALGFPDLLKVVQRVRLQDGSRYWARAEDFASAAEAVRRAVTRGPGVT